LIATARIARLLGPQRKPQGKEIPANAAVSEYNDQCRKYKAPPDQANASEPGLSALEKAQTEFCNSPPSRTQFIPPFDQKESLGNEKNRYLTRLGAHSQW
jgi:hypothetical protein